MAGESRTELLQWINQLLDVGYYKVRPLSLVLVVVAQSLTALAR